MEEEKKIDFEKKLMEEKEELEKILSSFATKDKNFSENWKTKFPNFDKGSLQQEENSDEVEEYTNLLPIEHKFELKLLDVKRALEKIEGENYGICENCGKKIENGRLEIIPETKVCLICAK